MLSIPFIGRIENSHSSDNRAVTADTTTSDSSAFVLNSYRACFLAGCAPNVDRDFHLSAFLGKLAAALAAFVAFAVT